MKSFSDLKRIALSIIPEADECSDFGKVLRFSKSSNERTFGENEILIEKSTGQAMPFFMAIDRGLLTLSAPVLLNFDNGKEVRHA